jgi:hypothetical protein
VLLVIAIVVLLGAAALVIGQPLLRPGVEQPQPEAERTALEDAKQAKYREIRDLEVDFRSGKLSEADYRGLDSRLRAEAIEILRQIDRL